MRQNHLRSIITYFCGLSIRLRDKCFVRSKQSFQDSDRGLAGYSIVSSGHIFAKQGRTITRPQGRSDFLLFYVAKGTEHFRLASCQAVAEASSFILFRPNEPPLHVHRDEQRGEFYYVHFNAPEEFDLFGFESSRIYPTLPSSSICDLFQEIIGELQTKSPPTRRAAWQSSSVFLRFWSEKSQKSPVQSGNIPIRFPL